MSESKVTVQAAPYILINTATAAPGVTGINRTMPMPPPAQSPKVQIGSK